MDDPKTAVSLRSPTPSQQSTTSSKLHHGVSLPLNLALSIYFSISFAVRGKQEGAMAGIPIASLPVPQTEILLYCFAQLVAMATSPIYLDSKMAWRYSC